jgi:multisubunit Na+/H+ antiporter MnhG subunit
VSVRHAAASVLLIAGCSVEVLAVLGALAMRDALDRLHYVGLASYGALLCGIAILVRQSFSLIGDKALLTGLLLAFLGPALVHVTARALRIRAHGDWSEGIESHREERTR